MRAGYTGLRSEVCGRSVDVGSRLEEDDPKVIGPHGMNEEISRGRWMKQWAPSENLALANTILEPPLERTIMPGAVAEAARLLPS